MFPRGHSRGNYQPLGAGGQHAQQKPDIEKPGMLQETKTGKTKHAVGTCRENNPNKTSSPAMTLQCPVLTDLPVRWQIKSTFRDQIHSHNLVKSSEFGLRGNKWINPTAGPHIIIILRCSSLLIKRQSCWYCEADLNNKSVLYTIK